MIYLANFENIFPFLRYINHQQSLKHSDIPVGVIIVLWSKSEEKGDKKTTVFRSKSRVFVLVVANTCVLLGLK